MVRALTRPGAFPGARAPIEVLRTHISLVFLVGERAYKVKRPRDLGFLDFTSLEVRRRYCHEEVRLNRRLAPGVYDGVVPVVESGDSAAPPLRVPDTVVDPTDRAPAGVVEWAVRMVRLPDDRALGRLLEAGRIGPAELGRLGERLAAFHAAADRSERISAAAGWEAVRRNEQENFEQTEVFVGRTLSSRVFERLRSLVAGEAERHGALIERRAAAGLPRDAHGDLRLDHVYFLPPGAPGRSDLGQSRAGTVPRSDEIVVIDCIEFSERFRWADPVADVAFLVMELEFADRPDLAAAFAGSYFACANDPEGHDLLPYYTTYRDLVRAKVRSLQAQDDAMEARARSEAGRRAKRHFLRGLARLSSSADRPALVIVQGLPGVGKSTLAEGLAQRLGFRWIDTDRVRKELTGGLAADTGAEEAWGAGIYSEAWNDRTYRECERRAAETLFEGERAVVEGSFRRDPRRASFLDAADALGVPVLFLDCRIDAAEARRRLAHRLGGPSDATWTIHQRMSRDWDPPSPRTAFRTREVALSGTPDNALARATAILVGEGLA